MRHCLPARRDPPEGVHPDYLTNAPATFKSTGFKAREYPGMLYSLQVAPEDCTGCELCVQVCPSKDKSNPSRKALNMVPQLPLREAERENFAFFLNLPDPDRAMLREQYGGGSCRLLVRLRIAGRLST